MGCIKSKKLIKIKNVPPNSKSNNDKIQNNNIFIHYIGKNINNNISQELFENFKMESKENKDSTDNQKLKLDEIIKNDKQSKEIIHSFTNTDEYSDIFKLTNNSINNYVNKDLKFEDKYKIINEENYDFYYQTFKIQLIMPTLEKEEFFSMLKLDKGIFGKLVNDKKILEEVTMLSKLDSKYLLKIYECYISSKSYYLITEHCFYSRLNEKLRYEIKYTENQIRYIIFQILKAIKYLNEMNYLHIEVSPEKILLCDTVKNFGEEMYNIKLLIFFCPSRSNLLYNTKSFYYYIAPEIMEKKYNKNCCVWSIGIIIFQMFFGELSYNYNNDINEYVQIIRITYKYSDDISSELKDLLDRMIEIDPTKRISIEECLEHNWMRKMTTEILKGDSDSPKKEKDEEIKRAKTINIKK
jgi:serine/threonine protein kinase